MKKNIIIAAMAAASALLLSVSCQKDDLTESQSGISGGKTFTASIEQNLTKTTLTSEYKVNWTTGDIININGVTFKATADGTDATKATFAKDPDSQDDPTGATFTAIYPSNLYVTDNFTLPATQTYTAGAFNAPMYAQSATTSLSFKNICAVLAIKVTSDDITSLKSIKVKADKKLNGTFTVESTTDGYKAVIGTNGSEEVVLSLGDEAINLTSEGTTFYIAIPEQEYSYLKIYLSEDGTLYKRAMITKKAEGLGTIACNKIYEIDYETNAVQIYANGPYWSTMNIGATTETGIGLYFRWGEKTGHKLAATVDSSKFNGDKVSNAFEYTFNEDPTLDGEDQQPEKLPATNDAATVNWGKGWRMPIGGGGEFLTLSDSTTRAWQSSYQSKMKGMTFTGKSPYDDITLFFPAAGWGGGTTLHDAGKYGGFWSSTLTSSTHASNMYFDSTGKIITADSYYRYAGRTIRPVSDK